MGLNVIRPARQPGRFIPGWSSPVIAQQPPAPTGALKRDCPTCGAIVNHRCLDVDGRYAPTHAARLTGAAA
jgi:hypothetical protein